MFASSSQIRYRSSSSGFRNGSPLKGMGSTSSSFGGMQRNSSAIQTGMSQSGMRRSSYSSVKNTTGKLDNLHDQLVYIDNDVKQTRNVTKQASLYFKFMKDDLQGRRLPQMQSRLKQEIVALKKQLNISQRSDKLRYESIWQNLDLMGKNQRCIQGQLNDMRTRMEKIQRTMGFYSGFEKHKY